MIRHKIIDEVYVRTFGHSRNDIEFVGHFKFVWSNFSPKVVQELCGYWYEQQAGVPIIELRHWQGKEADLLGSGRTVLHGLYIIYRALVIDTMPPEIIRSVIAHELAHAHQYATNWFIGRPDNQATQDLSEADAKNREISWKYSPQDRDDWKVNIFNSDAIQRAVTHEQLHQD